MHRLTPFAAAVAILAPTAFASTLTCPNPGDAGEGYVVKQIPASMSSEYDAKLKTALSALPGAPGGWVLDPDLTGSLGCYEGVAQDLRVRWSTFKCFRRTDGINWRYIQKNKAHQALMAKVQKDSQSMAAYMMNPANAVPAQPQPPQQPQNVDMPSGDEMAAASDVMQLAQQMQAAAMAGDMAKVKELQAKIQAAKSGIKPRPKKPEKPAAPTAAQKAMDQNQSEMQQVQESIQEMQKLSLERDEVRKSATPDYPLCVLLEGNMTEGDFAKDAHPFAASGAQAVSQTLKHFPVTSIWNPNIDDVEQHDYSGHDVPTVLALVGSQAGKKVKATLMGDRATVDAYAKRIDWKALQSIAR